jgi:PAS domain S-box-containing protein
MDLAMKTDRAPERLFFQRSWLSVTMSCLAVLVFLMGGYWFIYGREEATKREHYEHLETIARLKTDQLLAWRQERLADARMNASGIVRMLTLELLQTNNPAALVQLTERLRFLQENEGYHNIILAKPDGRILVSLRDRNASLEPEEKILMTKALSSPQSILGDFYHCQTCEMIHIDATASVVDGANRVVAVLILVADPLRDIFPLMETWPVARADAESYLVRRDGNRVQLLSPLRHQASPSFNFTVLALSMVDNSAVRAVLGETGMALGQNYRNVPVLADIRAVPGTTWHMVNEMDLETLLAQARVQGGSLLFMVAMVVMVTVILARLDSVNRQKNISDALLEEQYARTRAQEEIRATLYGIGAGVIATDAEGLVTRMNGEAERLCGWKEEEALGQRLGAVFHALDDATNNPVQLPVSQVLTGESVEVSHHVLLVDRNGHRRPVTDSWSPIQDEQGKISGVVLIFRDQTNKKAMERAKYEIGKRYSDLVESVNDLIWETDHQHRFIFVSRRVEDMLGYRSEEILGRPWDTFFCLEEPHPDGLAHKIANHQPFQMICQTWMRKDGNRRIFESSATATFDQQGRFLGYRGISRDITDRRQAEEEQRKLQEQLLQAQKMDTIGRLAGGVAHDFNNMLTVICNYSEMSLSEIEEAHPLRKRLAAIHKAALHSSDLTRQLLAFARKQVTAPQILDLNETITGMLKMLKRLIGENIELQWKPTPEIWPVTMDPTQVGQVLANLAVNARDAIAGTGHLLIATENLTVDQAYCAGRINFSPGDYVALTVSDSGCGMTGEVMTHIFEPFFTTKGEGQGTGLGLATVHGIVYQNDGLIHAYSEPGQGTTFRIYLPRREAGTEVVCLPQSVDSVCGGETVLIVEDEITILELSTTILEKKGYTILAASTPHEALDLVRSYQGVIHLVITDVIMPQMNGRTLLEQINCLCPGIKSLYMSGYTADIIAQQGVIEAGLQFIEKPFSVKGLCGKVREVLDNV